MVESSRVICKALNQSSSLKGLHWPQITQQSTNPKPSEVQGKWEDSSLTFGRYTEEPWEGTSSCWLGSGRYMLDKVPNTNVRKLFSPSNKSVSATACCCCTSRRSARRMWPRRNPSWPGGAWLQHSPPGNHRHPTGYNTNIASCFTYSLISPMVSNPQKRALALDLLDVILSRM